MISTSSPVWGGDEGGLSLMPWPDVYINGDDVVEREEDMPRWCISLPSSGGGDVIQNNALCGNAVRAATKELPALALVHRRGVYSGRAA